MFGKIFDGIEAGGLWAAVSSGLLFSARGAFIPYFFVFFQRMSTLNYTEIAILLNIFVISQSLTSPFAGILVEKLKATLSTAILFSFYIWVFLIIINDNSIFSLSIGMAILGAAFSLSRLIFNRRIIATAHHKGMRRTISLRAIMMTGGSFCGNATGAYILVKFGPHAFIDCVFVVFCLAVLIFTIYSLKNTKNVRPEHNDRMGVFQALRIPGFRHDLVALIPPFLLYGCWGTLLPKYIIDSSHDISTIPVMYAVTTTSILTLTWFFNTSVFNFLKSRKIEDNIYPVLSTLFFSFGALVIAFSTHIWFITLGGVIFVIGEIIITPHLDEISRRHGQFQAGVFIGITQAVDGAIRSIGLLMGSVIYGILDAAGARLLTLPIIVGIALIGLIINKFMA